MDNAISAIEDAADATETAEETASRQYSSGCAIATPALAERSDMRLQQCPCSYSDFQHLCWLFLDIQKRSEMQFPIGQIVSGIGNFLAPRVRACAGGASHTCAIDGAGYLHCFENNSYECNVPPSLGRVTQVAAGWSHTCAIDAAGYLHCFGYNDVGQCSVPPSLGRVTQVAAGASHTCAIDVAGYLHCFGDSGQGQCSVPPSLGCVTQVAAGAFHTCAIDAAGYLHCFGDNDAGQCNVPPSLGRVTQVAAGEYHTCAIDAAGYLHCFGYNDVGQCSVPPSLGRVTQVALWDNSDSQRNAPPIFSIVPTLGDAAPVPAYHQMDQTIDREPADAIVLEVVQHGGCCIN